MSNCTINNHPIQPHFYIDDWFTPEEEAAVWKELEFYTNSRILEHAHLGPVARYEDGTPKASNFRVYPDKIYQDDQRERSAIFSLMNKQREKKFHAMIEKVIPYAGRQFRSTNLDNTIISYYHDNDYYEAHIDTFQFTCLIWFYKEPKAFTGGNIILTDINETVELKHNRMLFFPSWYEHQVTPINFTGEDKTMGLGRYVITHFYTYSPEKDRD